MKKNLSLLEKPVFRSIRDIKSYHVHIYYDGATKTYAASLRKRLSDLFSSEIEVGRWRDKAPQGPHPVSHYQVAFPVEIFNRIVPFLALNRGNLNILLHPNTGDGGVDWQGTNDKGKVKDAIDHIKKKGGEK